VTHQAVSHYHSLLESDPELLSASKEFLLERFRDDRLVFGGRTLSPYLRPHFVSRDQWTAVKAACEAVFSAAQKVGRIAPSDPLMMEQLGLSEAERDLVAMDPGYDDISVTSRLDSFLTSEEYRFVELNAECPAGIAYSDVAADIFLKLPVMERFTRDYPVLPMYCRQKMLDALLSIYRRAGGRAKRPTIGIIDYSDVPTVREFELFKEFFEAQGYPTVIADPRELELRRGRLYGAGCGIDIVYRRVLTSELLEKIDQCAALVEAYRTRAAIFINSFRTKFVHKKMLFGILTDERHQRHFSAAEREAIGRSVPWTRRMTSCTTTYNAARIDLIEFVRAGRDRLVLKPNDDYGGHGIYIGWESDLRSWDEAIENALAGDYLVQERVMTAREVFPFLDESNGSVRMIEQLVDLDPLLFFGRVSGGFTRLSTTSLANVTSGAGMVPTMIVG
jgi:hypothetical protein